MHADLCAFVVCLLGTHAVRVVHLRRRNLSTATPATHPFLFLMLTLTHFWAFLPDSVSRPSTLTLWCTCVGGISQDHASRAAAAADALAYLASPANAFEHEGEKQEVG